MSTHWGNHIKNNIAGNKYESDFFHYKVVACFVTLFLMSSSLKLNWILYQISKISILLLKVLKEQGQNNALPFKERNVYINRPDLNQFFCTTRRSTCIKQLMVFAAWRQKLPPGKLQCSSCRARSQARMRNLILLCDSIGRRLGTTGPPQRRHVALHSGKVVKIYTRLYTLKNIVWKASQNQNHSPLQFKALVTTHKDVP